MENESKPKKANAWLDHVKQMKEQNPDKSYKKSLMLAKNSTNLL